MCVAVPVDLLRNKTKEGKVDENPEDEEGEDDDLAGSREEETNTSLGCLVCRQSVLLKLSC